MHTLFRYIRPKLPVMGVQLGIKFFGTIIELLLPWMLSRILDEAVPARQVGIIWGWGALMVGCAGAALVANICANRMATRISSDITRRLRHDLFDRVLRLSCAQENTFTTPSLISRLTSDTYNTHQLVDRMQRLGVRGPILLLGGILLCLAMEPVLTLVLAAILPLLAAVVWGVSRKGVAMYTRTQAALDDLVRRAQESMRGIRVIQALSRGPYERQRFAVANDAVVHQEQRAALLMNLTNPVMNLLLNSGLTLVVVVGALRVNAGLTTTGTIIAFLSYFTLILNALMMVSRLFVMYSKGAASARRIAQVLEAPPDSAGLALPATEQTPEQAAEQAPGQTPEEAQKEAPEQAVEQVPMPTFANKIMAAQALGAALASGPASSQAPEEAPKQAAVPCIRFEGVSFSYNGLRDQLRDISFTLLPGQTLGILGATGSGKSTLLALLLGLYPPTKGRVTLDGQDLRSLSPAAFYTHFGVVFQNDFLYAGTLGEAVDLARGLRPEQLRQALHAAQGDFVLTRPEGLEGPLAARGANLSGGQKQRLLLARALAAGPDILLLDDSSSALDYQTDAALRRALAQGYRRATKVIVAQRISSIRHADCILVLENGRVIGQGTHDRLLESCQTYQQIAQLQMGEAARPTATV